MINMIKILVTDHEFNKEQYVSLGVCRKGL